MIDPWLYRLWRVPAVRRGATRLAWTFASSFVAFIATIWARRLHGEGPRQPLSRRRP
jgi:hypothetical protein